MSVPVADEKEKHNGHEGSPGAILAASLHTGNPGVGLFVPYKLILYLDDWPAAAVYSFIAQASMANAPWGGIRDDQPPGDEVCMTYEEISLGAILSESAIAKAVKHLVECGLLTVSKRQSERHGWVPVNHYRCNFNAEAHILDEWVEWPGE